MKCVFIKGKASHFANTDKSEKTYCRESHDLMLEGWLLHILGSLGNCLENTRLFELRLHYVTKNIKTCAVLFV